MPICLSTRDEARIELIVGSPRNPDKSGKLNGHLFSMVRQLACSEFPDQVLQLVVVDDHSSFDGREPSRRSLLRLRPVL